MLTLYVARDRSRSDRLDPGSLLCTGLLETMPEVPADVVECTAGRRPAFVTGTPTVEHGRDVLQGHRAVAHLQALAIAAAERRGAARSTGGGGGGLAGAGRAPPRALAPACSPRDEDADREPERADREPEAAVAHEVAAGGMWETQIDDAADEGEAPAKLKSEDLQRALQARGVA